MVTRFKRANHPPGAKPDESFVKWLLAMLGLLWLGSLTVRTLRAGGNQSQTRSEAQEVECESSRSRFMGAIGEPVAVPSKPSRGHETRDASAKWILGLVIFLLVFGLGIHGILGVFLSVLKHTPPPTDGFQPREPAARVAPGRPPFPVLQISPAADLHAFRVHEQAELNSYGWIDHTSGIVRIPIERAMDMILREGLPTRTSTNANQTGPSSYQLIKQRAEHRQEEVAP